MTTALESRLVMPKFSLDEAQSAANDWRFNCGPAALAVVTGINPDEIRPLMGDFESKGYTNPRLMFDCLNRMSVSWEPRKAIGHYGGLHVWPRFGLVRVQWEGPWTQPGVPIRARYRHTHWIAVDSSIDGEEPNIFDINCMCVGGWVPLSEWRDSVVPWILKECEPKANGGWHLTHVLEIMAKP